MRVLAIVLALSIPTFAQANANLSITGSLTPGGVASVALNSAMAGEVFLLVDLLPGKTVFPMGGGDLTIGLPPTFLALPLGRTDDAGQFGMSFFGPSANSSEDQALPSFTLYAQALVLSRKAIGDTDTLDSAMALSQVRSFTVAIPAQ